MYVNPAERPQTQVRSGIENRSTSPRHGHNFGPTTITGTGAAILGNYDGRNVTHFHIASATILTESRRDDWDSSERSAKRRRYNHEISSVSSPRLRSKPVLDTMTASTSQLFSVRCPERNGEETSLAFGRRPQPWPINANALQNGICASDNTNEVLNLSEQAANQFCGLLPVSLLSALASRLLPVDKFIAVVLEDRRLLSLVSVAAGFYIATSLAFCRRSHALSERSGDCVKFCDVHERISLVPSVCFADASILQGFLAAHYRETSAAIYVLSGQYAFRTEIDQEISDLHQLCSISKCIKMAVMTITYRVSCRSCLLCLNLLQLDTTGFRSSKLYW